VYVSQEAVRYLADLGARTVDIDYLSVGGFYKDGAETHQALLEAGIWGIEGLNARLLHRGSGISQSLFLYATFYLQTAFFRSGRCWIETSDLLLVRQATLVSLFRGRGPHP
jgi:hypothetical protein